MNQRQENKNSAFLNVEEHFEKNAVIVDTLPPLVETVAEIKVVRTAIDALIAKQSVDISGTTNIKENDHDMLIKATVDVSNRLVAFATIEEKPVLLAAAKTSDSALRKLADTKLKGASQGILDQAIANVPGAEVYGLAAEVIENLRTKLNAYSTSITQPKMGIDTLKQITSDLDKAFKQDDILFAKADKLVKLFKDSQPVFHDSYFNLRKIINSGKGSFAMQMRIKDAATGVGLPKVKIVIEEVEGAGKMAAAGSDLAKIVKISSAKGGSNTKSMPDGNYIATASRPDYVTQTVNFTIVNGVMTNVVIDMVKA